MSTEITARQLFDRIRQQSGPTWKDTAGDGLDAGSPDTIVTGIVTSFAPGIEVLQKAIASGKNLIVTQQPAFYGETDAYFKNDPAYTYKRNFINQHGLVLYRYDENWQSRAVDGQLLGLALALGWDRYHLHDSAAGGPAYGRGDNYFELPEGSLAEKMREIEASLKIRGIRVIGDPGTKIRKVALSHGMFRFTELQTIMQDPSVDLVVLAEAIEWESPEYFRDYLTWKGNHKAMILLGREASEDPGYDQVATWLRTFIPEVPVEWISAGEPFWVP